MSKHVLKVPLFLKLLEHGGWWRAKQKWKGEQTVSTVGAFIATAEDDTAAHFIKKVVDEEDMPVKYIYDVFERYRDVRYRRQQAVAPKGKLVTKNSILVLDRFGILRDDHQAMVATITSADIGRMVDAHNKPEPEAEPEVVHM